MKRVMQKRKVTVKKQAVREKKAWEARGNELARIAQIRSEAQKLAKGMEPWTTFYYKGERFEAVKIGGSMVAEHFPKTEKPKPIGKNKIKRAKRL